MAIADEIESLKEEKSSAIQIAVYSKSNNPVRIEFNVIDDVEVDAEVVSPKSKN